MKFARTALALFLATATATSMAAFPDKPIRLVIGFPAGGPLDQHARLLSDRLQAVLGQPIIIDYKPGAAGNLMSEHVARAKPDGYTLAFGTAATHGSNAALYKKLSFDVEADFVPVALILDVSNVLMVNPDVLPAKNFAEFVTMVSANPGKYNFASTGNGTGTHMAFAELNARLNLNMVHVPYKGGPDAITSVLKGETCCMMSQVQTGMPHYKAGKVRFLGVTTAKRVAAVSEVPAIAESGLSGAAGFDSSIWFGIFAPKGTDAQIVAKINSAVKAVLEQPEIRSKFEAGGNTIRIESPEQFRATVKANRAKWAEVVRAANVSID